MPLVPSKLVPAFLGVVISGLFLVVCTWQLAVTTAGLWRFAVVGRSEWVPPDAHGYALRATRNEWLGAGRRRHKRQIALLETRGGLITVVAPVGADMTLGWIRPSSAKEQDLPATAPSYQPVYGYAAHPAVNLCVGIVIAIVIILLSSVICYSSLALSGVLSIFQRRPRRSFSLR